jgi:hypothetical protein
VDTWQTIRSAGRRRYRRLMARVHGLGADVGMTTAEYAVGTIAAVAFAALLYRVVRSSEVQNALTSIITSALHGI